MCDARTLPLGRSRDKVRYHARCPVSVIYSPDRIGLRSDYFGKTSSVRSRKALTAHRRKCFSINECGKQDLNLHPIAGTRPSTFQFVFDAT